MDFNEWYSVKDVLTDKKLSQLNAQPLFEECWKASEALVQNNFSETQQELEDQIDSLEDDVYDLEKEVEQLRDDRSEVVDKNKEGLTYANKIKMLLNTNFSQYDDKEDLIDLVDDLIEALSA